VKSLPDGVAVMGYLLFSSREIGWWLTLAFFS
jgi:hypothetical protein